MLTALRQGPLGRSTAQNAVRAVSTRFQSTLAYRVFQDSSSDAQPTKTAFIMHGILGNKLNWRTFSQKITKRHPEWKFISLDHRGHGDSPSFSPPHDLEACAEDVIALAEELEVEPDAIFGHSFGGKVALQYLQTCKDRAAKLPDQAWVLDSLPGTAKNDYKNRALTASVENVLPSVKEIPLPITSKKELIEDLQAKGIGLGEAQWLTTNLRLTKTNPEEYTWKMDIEVIETLFQNFLSTDLWPLVENASSAFDDVQLHFVQAERNSMWTKEIVDKLKQLEDQNVHHHLLKNSGHWVHIDNPQDLLDTISKKYIGANEITDVEETLGLVLSMVGRATRRQIRLEKERALFEVQGDGRTDEEKEKARQALASLQAKLKEDAVREDGFYFIDGEFREARRPRITDGMLSKRYDEHRRSVRHTAIASGRTNGQSEMYLISFGLDQVVVWNMKNKDRLAAMQTSPTYAQHICGDVGCLRYDNNDVYFPIVYAADHTFATCMYRAANVSLTIVPDQSHNESAVCGHEQQISGVQFSLCGEYLVTASYDSTAILWKLKFITSKEYRVHPLHAYGAFMSGITSVAFLSEPSLLILCGGEEVKVWSVPSQEAIQERETTSFRKKVDDWETAIPYSLSFERTMRMLTTHDTLSSLLSNDSWAHYCLPDTVLPALSLPGISTLVSGEGKDKEEASIFQFASQQAQPNSTVQSVETTAISEVERLKQKVEAIEHFDFEYLLNPQAPLQDARRNSQECVTIRSPIAIQKEYLRYQLPTTSEKGKFIAHTASITCCDVSVEENLLVTVSIDKTIKTWQLDSGVFQSSTKEAHTLSILTCALTPSAACQESGYPMLLATGGKDNLVKVWKNVQTKTSLDCVFTLSGHYDAVTSCTFDPTAMFIVSTSNDCNVFQWCVRPAPPDAPAQLHVDRVDRFEISISWEHPVGNGSAITHYLIRTTQLTDGADKSGQPKRKLETKVLAKYKAGTVGNLLPGVQYQLDVAAVNSIDTGKYSETVVTETLAFIPSQVTKPVQFTDVQANSIRLLWTYPCPNGAVITSYTIRCLPERKSIVPVHEVQIPATQLSLQDIADVLVDRTRESETKTPPTKVPKVSKKVKMIRAKDQKVDATGKPKEAVFAYTLSDLWAGEIYQFVVAAENRCGLGNFSQVSDYVKMDSSKPDIPKPPAIVDIGKSQISIQWEKPRCNGSEILQYVLRWKQFQENEDTFEMKVENIAKYEEHTMLAQEVPAMKFTIEGLEPGQFVRTWIAATNLIDNKLCFSDFSPSSVLVSTLRDVPIAPSPPTLITPTSYSIRAVFDEPKCNGAQIMRYNFIFEREDVEFGIVTKQVEREFTLEASELIPYETEPRKSKRSWVFDLDHLSGGTRYLIAVQAVNELGAGMFSGFSKPTRTADTSAPATIPIAPIITEVAPTKISVQWNPPENDGGSELSTYILQYQCAPDADLSTSVHPSTDSFWTSAGMSTTSASKHELTVCSLRPKTGYYFRVAAKNRARKVAPFSPVSTLAITPSLVEFTITSYFASRPPMEHQKARVLQRSYRQWKIRKQVQGDFNTQLHQTLRRWHLL